MVAGKTQLLTLREHLSSLPDLWWVRVSHFVIFLEEGGCPIMCLYVLIFRVVMSVTISA